MAILALVALVAFAVAALAIAVTTSAINTARIEAKNRRTALATSVPLNGSSADNIVRDAAKFYAFLANETDGSA